MSVIPSSYDDDYRATDAPERGDFGPLPEGTYQGFIDRFEVRSNMNTGDPEAVWTIKVAGPKHAGRLVWHQRRVNREGLPWLKQDLHTLGFGDLVPSDLNSEAVRARFLNVGVGFAVKHKPSQTVGKPFVNVYLNERLSDAPTPASAGMPTDASPPVEAYDDDDVPF